MIEYLIVLGLVLWAFGDLLLGIILVTGIIVALGAAIWKK